MLPRHHHITCNYCCSALQVMQSTRLGQGAKFFRAEECRDNHGRLQPAPPVVLGPMAADSGLSTGGTKPQATGQVRKSNSGGWAVDTSVLWSHVVGTGSWSCMRHWPASLPPTALHQHAHLYAHQLFPVMLLCCAAVTLRFCVWCRHTLCVSVAVCCSCFPPPFPPYFLSPPSAEAA